MARRNGSSEISELYLFIRNDGELYRQQGLPIIKNLTAKKASGKYNSTLAAKLYGYLAENGAKKYTQEYARGSKWNEMFSVADRKAVAVKLRDDFEGEFESGAYDEYIPKKYQAKQNPNIVTPLKSLIGQTIKVVRRGAMIVGIPVGRKQAHKRLASVTKHKRKRNDNYNC